ncbi:MAG: GMC oxidoreductase [Ilumatobacter sp.]
MKWAVVGAGSAGCVVARRLIDAGQQVTLIEAGPPLPPGGVPSSIDGSDALAALAEPGRTHTGLLARRSRASEPAPYWRGRGVGGSSAVHGMVARWGSADQQRAWGWHDADELRSRVLVPTEEPEVSELGRLDRLLLATRPDAAVRPLTRRFGRRVTSAEAYLWPVLDRIELVTGAVVDRVALDNDGAAIGVVLADGSEVRADRVVLCAGAIHTPPILLRSGIVNEVGEHLTDHPAAGIVLQLRDAAAAGGLVTATTAERDQVQVTPLNHLGPGADANLAMLSIALLQPHGSAGSVRLATDDPHDHPVVDLGLLADQRDLADLAAAVRATLVELTEGPLVDAVDAAFIDDAGTTTAVLADDEVLERWLLDAASGYVHAACSCRGAVDETGHVRSHDALAIADASIFPEIPDANLHLPTTVLAEHFVSVWLDSL